MAELEGDSARKQEWRPPELIATSGELYACSIAQSRVRENTKLRTESETSDAELGQDQNRRSHTSKDETEDENNYFRSMQWSPDGTCLITTSADGNVRTFIVPIDLLESHQQPLHLSPYTIHAYPEPVYASVPYPFFSLSDPQTTLLLTSPRDLPIRLTNILSPDSTPLASYPLISPTTEAYLTPSSLLFHPSGTHFYTGTDSLVALFDVSRPGEGPSTRLPTIPSKRHKLKGGGVGMRGIVSALSLQPSAAGEESKALIAAGAWTRQVSLYDAAGMGGTVSSWSVEEAADQEAGIGGAGVSQVLWSACGRYLFVVERKSDGVLVYDVRVTGRLVGWLEGRKGNTNQRLSVQVVDAGEKGTEIWAGGMDGYARVWNWRGLVDGGDGEASGLAPEVEWKAHDSTATSVALHGSGSVVATSSGEREHTSNQYRNGDDDESEREENGDAIDPGSGDTTVAADNSIKIWRL